MTAQLYVVTSIVLEFQFLKSFIKTYRSLLYPSGYKVVSHFGFDLYSSDDVKFYVFICSLYTVFREILFRVFAHFYFLIFY